jgi:NitT/TauT family transport system substrate-binding protein
MFLALVALFATQAFAADPSPNDTLSVVVGLGSTRPSLVVLAQQLGYYKDEGIKVNFDQNGTDPFARASIGKVDLVPTAVPFPFIGQGGKNLVVIGGTAYSNTVYIAKPALVAQLKKNPKRWEGLTLATSPNNTFDLYLFDYLKSQGVDVSKIKTVNIADLAARNPAVQSGQVDVSGQVTEYAQTAADDFGLQILYNLALDLPNAKNAICCRLTTSRETITAKRPALVKFEKALIRAYKFAKEHQEQAIQILSKWSGTDPKFIYDQIYNSKIATLHSPDPNRKALQVRWNYEQKAGFYPKLNKGENLDSFLDLSIYKEALAAVEAQFPNDPTLKLIHDEYVASDI